MPEKVDLRYRAALELYRTTDLTVKAICERARVTFGGFRSYLYRHYRETVFARHGITVTKEEASATKLRKSSGQSAATHAKYREAIETCDNVAYVEFNVSQIARLFGLNPSSLGNQLRNHYPEILERREKERRRLGVNDNLHRGVKPWCKEQYAAAVEHLRNTDDTIKQTADLYDLSYSGLREHLLYYYKDLIRERAYKRERAKTNKIRGGLNGNGGKHEPTSASVEKYREAIRLYRFTAMTQKEICAETGVTLMGLRHHLRIWNRELVLEHYNTDGCKEKAGSSGTKRYLKSTAAKYADAIGRLKATGYPTARVAKESGLNPESFRNYLYEHEPELAATLGKTMLDNGRVALVRCEKKYGEAVRLYGSTAEPLRSIARRLGLPYNSVSGFVRRNHPDAIEAHNRLLEQKTKLVKEKKIMLREKEYAESSAFASRRNNEEKERILRALKQAGGNRRDAAKLLGICRSTLYNKLNALDLSEDV